jgi:hypothetical protein
MSPFDGTIRLDFSPVGAEPVRSPGLSRETLSLTERQRARAPYPHGAVTITQMAPGTEMAALAGASLSVGPYVARREWTGSPDFRRQTHMLIALTNAREGREEAFDDWYWSQHFPDGLRLPGAFAGRRYRLADGAAGDYRHLALYQFDIADIGITIDALAQRSGTPEMPITDAISPMFQAWFVAPRALP